MSGITVVNMLNTGMGTFQNPAGKAHIAVVLPQSTHAEPPNALFHVTDPHAFNCIVLYGINFVQNSCYGNFQAQKHMAAA